MVRGILAVFVGLIAIFVSVYFMTGALTIAFGLDPMTTQTPPGLYLFFNILLGMVCAVFGGYAAGLVARRDEVRHAMYVAAVGLILGLVSLAMPAEGQPIWYLLITILTMPPAVVFGGWVRMRQARHDRPAPTTAPESA
ncbi:MAG TPA: hypothetical protein VGB22_01925 [candidate division Zixibacteria bacterium]|jgi:uncharacterized membrane protein